MKINCNNVQGGCSGNIFNRNFRVPNDASAYGYYDFDSVMHYGQCAFSTNPNCPTPGPAPSFPDGGITISVNTPFRPQAIGQLQRLSALDQATLSFLYPFPDWRFLDCNYKE